MVLREPMHVARAAHKGERGARVDDFKPFYKKAKVTVIGVTSIKQVLAVITIKRFFEASFGCRFNP